MAESENQKNADHAQDRGIDLDQYLFLHRDAYERDFLPAYEKLGIVPRRLVQFPVILPFHIPFGNGMCLTFQIDEQDACTLTFGTLSSVQHMHAGVVSEKSIEVPSHRSVVEMTYVLGDDSYFSLAQDDLSHLFDQVLGKLNSVIAAYMITTKDYRVHRVTKEMMEFGSFYRVIRPDDWSDQQKGIFLLHWQVPFEKPELSPEFHEQVVWYAHVVEESLNPFTITEELSLAARREFLGGSFREAVVHAQTAVETLLSVLLSRAMGGEGKPPEEIAAVMENVGFVTRVRREYHNRFGGSWNIDRRGTPVGEWYARTYQLRNQVVHGGYTPAYAEASQAVDAAAEMIRFVIQRVRASRERYPDLQGFFLDTE